MWLVSGCKSRAGCKRGRNRLSSHESRERSASVPSKPEKEYGQLSRASSPWVADEALRLHLSPRLPAPKEPSAYQQAGGSQAASPSSASSPPSQGNKRKTRCESDTGFYEEHVPASPKETDGLRQADSSALARKGAQPQEAPVLASLWRSASTPGIAVGDSPRMRPRASESDPFPPGGAARRPSSRLSHVARLLTFSDLPGVNALNNKDGYLLMEEGGEEQDKQNQLIQQVASLSERVRWLQCKVTLIICVLLLVAACVVTTITYNAFQNTTPSLQHKLKEILLRVSIPVVAMLFTWFHIWLAIQMMFRPLEFMGLWQHGSSGLGLGWQGVIPRKAAKMAKTSYVCARPYLDPPRAWLKRVDSRALVSLTRCYLVRVIQDALAHTGARHFPRTDRRLPSGVRTRVVQAAVDKIEETSPQLWQEISDHLCHEEYGIDNDGMIVKVFTEKKELLNHFFQQLGSSEFRFIERSGAVLGFLCGVIQLMIFDNLDDFWRAVFMPTTGFFLGILTNWLAITMVFKPVDPQPVYLCGMHVCNIQGLFLKRQKAVAEKYSAMICEHFLQFDKVIEYLQTQHVLWERLKATYIEHNTAVLQQTLGIAATWVAPLALGQQQYALLEEDLRLALVEGMAAAKEFHKVAAGYISKVTDLEKRNCEAIQGMPPRDFEALLHPIFQEDEWILILLGGILGFVVGSVQAVVLAQ